MELREKIAALVHSQWSAWMKHQWATGKWEDGNLTLLAKDVREWCRQATTSYLDLSEEEKESDLKWADKYVSLLYGDSAYHPTWEVSLAMDNGWDSFVAEQVDADFFEVYDDGRVVLYNKGKTQVAVYAPGQWYGVRRKEE